MEAARRWRPLGGGGRWAVSYKHAEGRWAVSYKHAEGRSAVSYKHAEGRSAVSYKHAEGRSAVSYKRLASKLHTSKCVTRAPIYARIRARYARGPCRAVAADFIDESVDGIAGCATMYVIGILQL